MRIIFTRAAGVPADRIEASVRLLLNALNQELPGTANFVALPSLNGDKLDLRWTTELAVGISGVASAWIVPAIQHWYESQVGVAPDAGVVVKLGELEVHIKGDHSPEMFAKVTEAITQAAKA